MTTEHRPGQCDCERCKGTIEIEPPPKIGQVIAGWSQVAKAVPFSREAIRKERAEATVKLSQPAEACEHRYLCFPTVPGDMYKAHKEVTCNDCNTPMAVLPASTLEKVRLEVAYILESVGINAKDDPLATAARAALAALEEEA